MILPPIFSYLPHVLLEWPENSHNWHFPARSHCGWTNLEQDVFFSVKTGGGASMVLWCWPVAANESNIHREKLPRIIPDAAAGKARTAAAAHIPTPTTIYI